MTRSFNRACYRCPAHGRVRVEFHRVPPQVAPCPTCGSDMQRSPRNDNWGHVTVSEATYLRVRAYAERYGVTIGQVVAAATAGVR